MSTLCFVFQKATFAKSTLIQYYTVTLQAVSNENTFAHLFLLEHLFHSLAGVVFFAFSSEQEDGEGTRTYAECFNCDGRGSREGLNGVKEGGRTQ